MSDHIYNYIIGRIDKSRKLMVLVNYESRSNLVTQAQLMKVQFPNLNTLRMFLNDFEPTEKHVIHYSKIWFLSICVLKEIGISTFNTIRKSTGL